METRELSVGNHYQLHDSVLGGGIHRIGNGEDLSLAYDLLNDGLLYGIPLTKWWLERLGAEHVNSKSGLIASYKLAGIKFDVSNSGNVYHSQSNKPIHFVHRLQNLIFELKDIELTINK